MNNKIICSVCGIEKSENDYYLSRKNEGKMGICKLCFCDEIKNNKDLFNVFRKYDIPYINNLWESSMKNSSGNGIISSYMKYINSLSQYKNLTWKDSQLENDKNFEVPEEIFQENIVKNLKKEIESLNVKIAKSRESGDFGTYRNLIIAFKEVLNLYKEMNKEYQKSINFDNKLKFDKDENIELLRETIVNTIIDQLNKKGIV